MHSEDGLPGSSWLRSIDRRVEVHANALIATTCSTVVFSLVNLFNTTAFGTIMSLATASLMATYIILFGCVIARRVAGQPPLAPPSHSLGKYGLSVNSVAVLYSAWAVSSISVLTAKRPFDANSMSSSSGHSGRLPTPFEPIPSTGLLYSSFAVLESRCTCITSPLKDRRTHD
jgi:amino acid transporter